jgi:hypothetical protein
MGPQDENVDTVAPSNPEEESIGPEVDNARDKASAMGIEDSTGDNNAVADRNDDDDQEEPPPHTKSLKRPANADEEEDEEENVTVFEKPDINKPVKRARSAYFFFADDKRSEVQEKVRTAVACIDQRMRN